MAPEIIEPPHSIDTVNRRAVFIGCKNIGIPKPQVKWTKNDTELINGRYSITDDGDLRIRLVVLEDYRFDLFTITTILSSFS